MRADTYAQIGIQSLTRNSLRVSGSEWKEKHVKALRVVYILKIENLTITHLFDRDYIRTNDDNGR